LAADVGPVLHWHIIRQLQLEGGELRAGATEFDFKLCVHARSSSLSARVGWRYPLSSSDTNLNSSASAERVAVMQQRPTRMPVMQQRWVSSTVPPQMLHSPLNGMMLVILRKAARDALDFALLQESKDGRVNAMSNPAHLFRPSSAEA